MWTSKIGQTSKVLKLGLSDESGLVVFGSLTSPTLKMKLRNDADFAPISQTVLSYTDPNVPAKYNAQVVFDFAGVVPGVYSCEVDASIGGNPVSFPSDGFFFIRFLEGY